METLNYKGFDIEITDEDYPESPREQWDNLGSIIAWHRNYNLSDKGIDFAEPEDFEDWLKDNPSIVLPVYMYDHSGISLSTGQFSCPWDSGQLGWIFVTKEKIREEYGVKRITNKLKGKVIKVLRQEIETYSQYCEGRVYGFIVETDDGEHIGSCYGFYGEDWEDNGLLEYAQDDIDCYISTQKENRAKQLKAWIKNKVSLLKRTPFILV